MWWCGEYRKVWNEKLTCKLPKALSLISQVRHSNRVPVAYNELHFLGGNIYRWNALIFNILKNAWGQNFSCTTRIKNEDQNEFSILKPNILLLMRWKETFSCTAVLNSKEHFLMLMSAVTDRIYHSQRICKTSKNSENNRKE
jgi:hypothetical protein